MLIVKLSGQDTNRQFALVVRATPTSSRFASVSKDYTDMF